MIDRIGDLVHVLLSAQMGTVSVLRTVSQKVKAEAKEALSTPDPRLLDKTAGNKDWRAPL